MQIKALIPAILSLALSAPAIAQTEPDYPCYIDFGGRITNLTSMCGAPELAAGEAGSEEEVLSGAELDEALSLASTVYADTYCEYRARGGTDQQASEAAAGAAAGYLLDTPDGSISTEWFAEAEYKSNLLCPELQPTTRYD